MLDGANRIANLATQAKELNMRAVACTDHGNMCGAVEFYKAMVEKEIKPIIGCEFYVAPSSRTERNPREKHAQGYHLVLLAENLEGYQNLCRLNATAWLEGFYYKPRIDKAVLTQHSKGLVALSACLAGEVAAHVLERDDKQAVRALTEYTEIFGRHGFYLELQDHGIPEQQTVNRRFIELGAEYGVPLVVTNDSHYLKREHAQAHEVLLCVGTQTTMQDPNRLRFSGTEFYFKSGAEMAERFAQHPEALRNTAVIAERCNLFLDLGNKQKNHYPVYQVEGGGSREELLRRLCIAGMKERYGVDAEAHNLPPQAREMVNRMDFELKIIAGTGFTSYFLVVWDFLHFARSQGIPVGPGRGSGAGSIVAYLTRITDIDPIRYGLLFERFLNPDRVSPPDFDIDLCERRRHEVIAYVRGKYGAANVAQIGTFGTLKAKQVLKDVARVLGRPFADGNRLTQMVPADPKMTLEKALSENQEFREMVQQEPWIAEVLGHSKVLESLCRNMSIHAAGVIIGDQPLSNLVPLAKGANDEVITQYPMAPCEELGLLKMDFLGLRTLTIIQDALDLVAQHRHVNLKSPDIPLDEPRAFDLLNKGDTIGVFQLESGGMRDLCRRFGVHRLEDIIALIALYRPGPMQFLDEFISRKMGSTPIDYDVPAMEPILRETYGIMLYQEQVMQVVQKVAGFSLGGADILRRAMGKKKAKEMEQQYDKFVAGCKGNGIDEGTANAIWEKIAMFAGYGFNKSHSAAYAMLSYRTGYLKAMYPTEFMAAVLNSEVGNAENLAFFLKECAEMKIQIKPPDVNTSGMQFSVDGNSIRFGLAAVKGVGEVAAKAALDALKAGGPFTSLVDFCERTGAGINRRVLENLCRSGAFDCFGLRRSQIFAMLDESMALAQQTAQDRKVGQGSLFDFGGDGKDSLLNPTVPDVPEWGQRELLGAEKELLGFYVTGHPIAEFAPLIRTYQLDPLNKLPALPDQTATRVGGIVASIDVKRSKKDNRPWAILGLEDLDGIVECMVFSDAYENYSSLIEAGTAIFLEGTVSRRDGEEQSKLVADKIIPIAEVPERYVKEIHIRLHQASTEAPQIEKLKEICERHSGPTTLILCLICSSGEMAFVQPGKLRIRNTAEFRQSIREMFGEECLLEKADRTRPPSNQRGRFPSSRGNPAAVRAAAAAG